MSLAELDQTPSFADLRLAWNANGLGCSLHVSGKKQKPRFQKSTPTESDGLQLWIDTRNTQSVHRATRFCHHFCVLPTGAGRQGRAPMVLQFPIARARDEAPLAPFDAIQIWVDVKPDGYVLEVWFPAEALHGFDPEVSPRLGFFYHVRDLELGEQFLTVGHEFPFAHDPSLWSTLDLTDQPA